MLTESNSGTEIAGNSIAFAFNILNFVLVILAEIGAYLNILYFIRLHKQNIFITFFNIGGMVLLVCVMIVLLFFNIYKLSILISLILLISRFVVCRKSRKPKSEIATKLRF